MGVTRQLAVTWKDSIICSTATAPLRNQRCLDHERSHLDSPWRQSSGVIRQHRSMHQPQPRATKHHTPSLSRHLSGKAYTPTTSASHGGSTPIQDFHPHLCHYSRQGARDHQRHDRRLGLPQQPEGVDRSPRASPALRLCFDRVRQNYQAHQALRVRTRGPKKACHARRDEYQSVQRPHRDQSRRGSLGPCERASCRTTVRGRSWLLPSSRCASITSVTTLSVWRPPATTSSTTPCPHLATTISKPRSTKTTARRLGTTRRSSTKAGSMVRLPKLLRFCTLSSNSAQGERMHGYVNGGLAA